jgi:hypothetical protein
MRVHLAFGDCGLDIDVPATAVEPVYPEAAPGQVPVLTQAQRACRNCLVPVLALPACVHRSNLASHFGPHAPYWSPWPCSA